MVAALIGIEQTISPRWVWWSADTARALVADRPPPGALLGSRSSPSSPRRRLAQRRRADLGPPSRPRHRRAPTGRPHPICSRSRARTTMRGGSRGRSPRPGMDRRAVEGRPRSPSNLGIARARRPPLAGRRTGAAPRPGSIEHRTVGIGGCAPVCRARGRRTPHRHRRGRTDHLVVHRPAPDRRGGRGTTRCRTRPARAAPSRGFARRLRPASTPPASSRSCDGSASRCPTRAPGVWNACATSTRSSMRSSPGARPSGSQPRSGTDGSTSTSGPTGVYEGSGRHRMARPAG